MMIRLNMEWNGHPAGKVVEEGAGVAEQLVRRGVATAVQPEAKPEPRPIETRRIAGPREKRNG